MNDKKIVFIIGDGQVEIEAQNFKGPACEAATKAFQEALGGAVLSKKRKPEFNQFDPQAQRLSAKTGGR